MKVLTIDNIGRNCLFRKLTGLSLTAHNCLMVLTFDGTK